MDLRPNWYDLLMWAVLAGDPSLAKLLWAQVSAISSMTQFTAPHFPFWQAHPTTYIDEHVQSDGDSQHMRLSHALMPYACMGVRSGTSLQEI